MKKVQILLITLLVGSMAFFSFKSKNSTRYGGTASVTVKVESVTSSSNLSCWSQWNASGKKAGDTKVIEVSTYCNHSNSTAAKEDLKRSIEFKMACYEKMISSISYDIDTCE